LNGKAAQNSSIHNIKKLIPTLEKMNYVSIINANTLLLLKGRVAFVGKMQTLCVKAYGTHNNASALNVECPYCKHAES
jgi:hypothetical protein